MTHFGSSEDVETNSTELDARLDAWSGLARKAARTRSSPRSARRSGAMAAAEQAATYEQAAPVEQLFAGYERYWTKRTEQKSTSPRCPRRRYAG